MFRKFVSDIVTCYGVDYPEDVMGGLKVTFSSLEWRPDTCKVSHIVYYITDTKQYETTIEVIVTIRVLHMGIQKWASN